jgi:hypothetical protein
VNVSVVCVGGQGNIYVSIRGTDGRGVLTACEIILPYGQRRETTKMRRWGKWERWRQIRNITTSRPFLVRGSPISASSATLLSCPPTLFSLPHSPHTPHTHSRRHRPQCLRYRANVSDAFDISNALNASDVPDAWFPATPSFPLP